MGGGRDQPEVVGDEDEHHLLDHHHQGRRRRGTSGEEGVELSENTVCKFVKKEGRRELLFLWGL